jgi:ligand-binding sensor domain-containing protein/signal transduction histidine kinase
LPVSKSISPDTVENQQRQTLQHKAVLELLIVTALLAVACSGFPPAFSFKSTTAPSGEAKPIGRETTPDDKTPRLGQAQDHTPAPSLWRKDLDQPIRFDHISLAQGLSQNSVFCILQDSMGFLWFGTQDGLNRYDGYQFEVYRPRPGDPNSLSHSSILAIHQDQQGLLWIGTNGGGLNRLDRETGRIVRYQHEPKNPHSLSGNSVYAIYGDRQGVLWVGTEGGLDRFEPLTNRFIHYQHKSQDPHSLGFNVVRSIYQDQEGTLWIGTDNGGLDRFDRETEQFTHYRHDPTNPHSLSNNVVTSIYEDGEGVLWVGTYGGGLNWFDRSTGQFHHYVHHPGNPDSLSSDLVRTIYQDQAGVLWIGTYGGGLNRFDRDTERFFRYQADLSNPGSLSDNFVGAIFEDKSGILWIGTLGGGINHIACAPQHFALYQAAPQSADGMQNSLSDSFVWSIFQDREGAFWIGTYGGGLNHFDRKSGSWSHYRHNPNDPTSLSNDTVRSIRQDRSGTLWIGTEGGLNRFEQETGRFIHYRYDPQDPNSLSHDVILTLYLDRADVLWIGTQNGLNRFDPAVGRSVRYQVEPGNPHSLSHNAVRAIHQGHSGTLWVGTEGGLNRFDRETEQFTRYLADPRNPHSLSNNHILSVYEDSAGTLWVGTFGGGLNRFERETETFTHYGEQDGLPSAVVYGILEEDAAPEQAPGYLWLSTNQGLSRFDPRTGTFTNYDVRDGLQSNEFNAGAYLKSHSGEMFFGGVNGFNAFYPDEVRPNPILPPIVLTSLKQGGEKVELGKAVESLKKVTFRWPNNFFEFEFAALNYCQPERNQYAYMLEGFDKSWNEIGTTRFGRYTNLPGGTYTLRLKASNNSGIWNKEGASIKVTIVPPLWERTWFRGLAILLLVGGVIGGYRLRVKSVEAQSRELERQVQERTSQLEALYRAEEKMHRHLHLDQVLQALVDVAVDLLHADESAVFVGAKDARGKEQKKLVMQVARGFSPEAMARLSSAWEEGMLGQVVTNGQPVFVEDTHSLGDSERTRVLQVIDSEGVRSFMHLPVQVNGKPFGVFHVGFGEPRAFSEDEQRLFLALAQRASLAIENAQLYEQAQELAALEERQRLARDLHDAVTQTLFSTSLIAEVLPRIWERNPDDGRRRLEQVRQATRSALAEMRTLLLELRPTGLAEADMGDLLRQLAEAVAGRARALVEVDIQGECTLPPDVHVTLYRIAQEALNNVAKHARARQALVQLCCQSSHVVLSIHDDGRGFDVEHVPPGRLGIGIMRERAEAIGARLEIESEPGQGTKVTVMWGG